MLRPILQKTFSLMNSFLFSTVLSVIKSIFQDAALLSFWGNGVHLFFLPKLTIVASLFFHRWQKMMSLRIIFFLQDNLFHMDICSFVDEFFLYLHSFDSFLSINFWKELECSASRDLIDIVHQGDLIIGEVIKSIWWFWSYELPTHILLIRV